MSLVMTPSLVSSTGVALVNTSWNLSAATKTALSSGYKSFTLQITWDPSVATVAPSSIQSIASPSNGDILSFDTSALSGGVLRIVGFSGNIQSFTNSLTAPVLTFQYSQAITYQPVNFYVNVEQFNGTVF